ncbi:hypothetical protein ACFXPT_08025 [Streptomyces goshikiensis]|uniref:hypothetical protein n=1 Tax=Streptomyces goshikiensis TaxID=1942 RepID=UPI0036C115BB
MMTTACPPSVRMRFEAQQARLDAAAPLDQADRQHLAPVGVLARRPDVAAAVVLVLAGLAAPGVDRARRELLLLHQGEDLAQDCCGVAGLPDLLLDEAEELGDLRVVLLRLVDLAQDADGVRCEGRQVVLPDGPDGVDVGEGVRAGSGAAVGPAERALKTGGM